MIDARDDAILVARLQAWLEETRAESAGLVEEPIAASAGPAPPGLTDLVEAFTALRHETKLQTKAGRQLGEQAEALLVGLDKAIDHFHAVEPKQREAAYNSARPLVDALVDLDEAIERARGAIERTRAGASEVGDWLAALSPWRRWLARTILGRPTFEPSPTRGAFAQTLLDGYALIQRRLQRAMAEQGITRMNCVGQRFDPDCMNVIDAVDSAAVPPGTVLEEICFGYTWQRRVIRIAQVRAVRGPNGSPTTSNRKGKADGTDSGD